MEHTYLAEVIIYRPQSLTFGDWICREWIVFLKVMHLGVLRDSFHQVVVFKHPFNPQPKMTCRKNWSIRELSKINKHAGFQNWQICPICWFKCRISTRKITKNAGFKKIRLLPNCQPFLPPIFFRGENGHFEVDDFGALDFASLSVSWHGRNIWNCKGKVACWDVYVPAKLTWKWTTHHCLMGDTSSTVFCFMFFPIAMLVFGGVYIHKRKNGLATIDKHNIPVSIW